MQSAALSTSPGTAAYVVVIPVKAPGSAKTRLTGTGDTAGHPGGALPRRELAMAFALDTVAACVSATAVQGVLVSCDDAGFAREVAALGATVRPDGTTHGLNAVLVQAAIEADRLWPERQAVVVCADLPALTAEAVDDVLTTAPLGREWFVADHQGSGTTMYSAPMPEFAPQFGHDSALAHRLQSAYEVPGSPRVHQDVDSPADLDAALAIGVGAHTAATSRSHDA